MEPLQVDGSQEGVEDPDEHDDDEMVEDNFLKGIVHNFFFFGQISYFE